MAKLRIRFVLNKGRRGAPMGKLGRISEQAEKFLRALSSDSGVEVKPGEWLAAEFENGSVQFDAEYQGSVDAGIAQVFERNMEVLADFDPERDGLNGLVRDATALEYAKIGYLIDPDEEIGLGIIPYRGGAPKWRSITYSRSQSIKSKVENPVPAIGGVQGIIHAWVKGVSRPYIQVRELSSDQLVKVHYKQNQHSIISDAMSEVNAVVLISGECVYDRVNRTVVSMDLEKLKKVKNLSPHDFDSLFGAFPELEGPDILDDAS